MNKKETFVAAYNNTREQVKRNRPEAARKCMKTMLDVAFWSYRNSDSHQKKEKMEQSLKQWIAVMDELQNEGITENVLRCFNLPIPEEEQIHRRHSLWMRSPFWKNRKEENLNAADLLAEDAADIAGMIEDPDESQGKCADIFNRNKSAVVEIVIADGLRERKGTGFILSTKGYLLTNDHVVRVGGMESDCASIRMKPIDSEKSYPIEVLESDREADLALCRYDPNKVKGMKRVKRIADYSELQSGADCFFIGNVLGMGASPATGTVRFTSDQDGDLVYMTQSNPGDSGGPVFNRSGEVIGIHKSKSEAVDGAEASGLANATPMPKIDAFLEQCARKHGIDFENAAERMRIKTVRAFQKTVEKCKLTNDPRKQKLRKNLLDELRDCPPNMKLQGLESLRDLLTNKHAFGRYMADPNIGYDEIRKKFDEIEDDLKIRKNQIKTLSKRAGKKRGDRNGAAL